jgi:hypothetical protein
MKLLTLSLVALAVLGCDKHTHGAGSHTHGANEKSAASGPATKKSTATAADHGSETALGALVIGGVSLEIAQLGKLAAEQDGAIAAKVTKSPQGTDWRKLKLYMWVESATGERLTAPSKAVVEQGRLHLHASLPKGAAAASRLVFRLRGDNQDVRQALQLPGAATKVTGEAGAADKPVKPTHRHAKTPHDGMVAPLEGGKGAAAGWLELKLHDDKGDLELWLAKDKAMTQPLDLPLSAQPAVKFVDHKGRVVQLAVRDKSENKDEDGKPNVRGAGTNYFIFPGASGADASWLMGKTFQSIVVVSVPTPTGEARAELLLRPHTHAPGEEH